MQLSDFKEAVRCEVELSVGENCTVMLMNRSRNNGVALNGLMVQSDTSNISPVIYLDDYYAAYESGGVEFETIINNILTVYEMHKKDCYVDTSPLLNYEYVRDKIIYKLINTDKNTELLQHIPHIAFHDLSIVFQVAIARETYGNAYILIRNEHLATWGVSMDRIYEDACHNTPIINKYEIKEIDDAIRELMLSEESEEPEDMEVAPLLMFVLSNSYGYQGAACILYPGLLKEFADSINSNLYIIPMTVHDVLLLPVKKPQGSEYKELKDTIREVNVAQVPDEDILSNSLYYYDRNADDIIKL